MAYVNGPASFLLDLSRIFEQLKRDRLSSLNATEFYYYVRSPKEARQQQIPANPDKQITLIKKLAPQSGYEVVKTENERLLISITDAERFFTEYNKFAGIPKDIMHAVKAKRSPDNELRAIKRITVDPRSYDAANGILTIDGQKVYILKQTNRRGIRGETHQATLMRLLFNPVNRLAQGIPMRQVVSVTATVFDAKQHKLVKSYAAEINKKVKAVVDIDELITSNQNAVMIDKRYL